MFAGEKLRLQNLYQPSQTFAVCLQNFCQWWRALAWQSLSAFTTFWGTQTDTFTKPLELLGDANYTCRGLLEHLQDASYTHQPPNWFCEPLRRADCTSKTSNRFYEHLWDSNFICGTCVSLWWITYTYRISARLNEPFRKVNFTCRTSTSIYKPLWEANCTYPSRAFARC